MMRYRTIVADPPWDVKAGPLRSCTGEGFAGGDGRTRDLAYPTMSVAEIAALPVAGLALPDAHLYLWTINKYIDAAFDVARAWGFRYSTMLTWTKAPMGSGLGGCWGISTEHVLYCRRGEPETTGRIPSTWFAHKRPYDGRGKPMHSGKPEGFIDLVEQVSPGPYLELFARRNRLGWDTWGNESHEHVEMVS